MLEALGVKRLNGRVGGLMALRSLSFSELSAELTASGAEFTCGKRSFRSAISSHHQSVLSRGWCPPCIKICLPLRSAVS